MSQLFVSFTRASDEEGYVFGSHVLPIPAPSTAEEINELILILQMEYNATVHIVNFDPLTDAASHPATRGVYGYFVGVVLRMPTGLPAFTHRELLRPQPLETVSQLREAEEYFRVGVPQAQSLHFTSIKAIVSSEEDTRAFPDSSCDPA